MISERSVITGCSRQLVRAPVRKRRRAVEHDPGPHDVAADLVVADHAGRIRDRARIRQALARRVEHARAGRATPSSSSARARCVIRRSAATESQSPAARPAPGASAGRTPSRFIPLLIFTKTSSGRSSCRVLEHPHLVGVVDDDREPARGDLRQLVRAEETLEQQDALRCSAPRAARSAWSSSSSARPSASASAGSTRVEPVTVGVRLDDREHLRLRRASRAPARDSREARRGSPGRRSDGPWRAIRLSTRSVEGHAAHASGGRARSASINRGIKRGLRAVHNNYTQTLRRLPACAQRRLGHRRR